MHKCGVSICDSFDLFKSEFYILIQGLVISIIFGFANEEVLNVLRTHWRRKMMVRMVKKEGRQRTLSRMSMRVCVRDADTGECDGDHSNITQLTIT